MSAKKPAGRGKGFTAPELDRKIIIDLSEIGNVWVGLLSLIEVQLPLGGNSWDSLQHDYNRHLPSGWPIRDTQSLRRKYNCLRNSKKPTGDPECPDEVRRAKRAQRDMDAKSSVADLDDDGYNSLSMDDGLTDADVDDDRGHEGLIGDEDMMDPIMDLTSAGKSSLLTPVGQRDQPQNLRASGRCGKTPGQLAVISKRLDASSDVVMSAVAQKRQRVDTAIDRLSRSDDNNNMLTMMMMMHQKSEEREQEYRKIKGERDERREDRIREEARLERLEREETANRREQMMMMFLSKLFSNNDKMK